MCNVRFKALLPITATPARLLLGAHPSSTPQPNLASSAPLPPPTKSKLSTLTSLSTTSQIPTKRCLQGRLPATPFSLAFDASKINTADLPICAVLEVRLPRVLSVSRLIPQPGPRALPRRIWMDLPRFYRRWKPCGIGMDRSLRLRAKAQRIWV